MLLLLAEVALGWSHNDAVQVNANEFKISSYPWTSANWLLMIPTFPAFHKGITYEFSVQVKQDLGVSMPKLHFAVLRSFAITG